MKTISRVEAMQIGLKRYFTGVPCSKGHISERIAIDHKCSECSRLAQQKKRLEAGCKPWHKTEEDRKAARKATLQKYAKANAEKVKAAQIAYKANHPEKRKAAVLKWDKANPESKRIHAHTRRARKSASGGTLSKGLLTKLFALQKGKCACCKQPLGSDAQLDHIVPIAMGGSNTDENIQLLHGLCNRQKSAKHPVDFMQSKGFLL